MKRKNKKTEFKKIGENNARGHIIEVEEQPGSDFLIRYSEAIDIALGDFISIDTDPNKESLGTVLEVGSFCETVTPPVIAPFPVRIGDKVVNLVVIDSF